MEFMIKAATRDGAGAKPKVDQPLTREAGHQKSTARKCRAEYGAHPVDENNEFVSDDGKVGNLGQEGTPYSLSCAGFRRLLINSHWRIDPIAYSVQVADRRAAAAGAAARKFGVAG
jgi:hypothetical protein